MSKKAIVDWEERLTAQGVPGEQIAAAKLAAGKMADALESFTFTPCDPIAPSEFPAILNPAPRARDQE